MGPEAALEIQNGRETLAILCAIPAVMFALWASYFERYLIALKARGARPELGGELQRARLAGLCVNLAQLILFLATTPIRRVYPGWGMFFFLIALAAQMHIQSRAESSVREHAAPDPKGGPVAGDMWFVFSRMVFWSVIAGTLYSAFVMVSVVGAFTLGTALGLGTAARTGLVMIGCIGGVLLGLGACYGLGPAFVRRMMPCRAVQDPTLLKSLTECFTGAGLREPSFWILDLAGVRAGSAWFAGFASGRGWFRPGLFLSKQVVEGLSAEELRAVVLHEASHVRLSHMVKRLGLTLAVIGGVGITSSLLMFALYIARPDASAGPIGPVLAMMGFFVALGLLRRQSLAHEGEADFHAVNELGADLAAFSSALRKLDEAALTDEGRIKIRGLRITHPETERRIRVLENRLAQVSAAQPATSSEKTAA